MSNPCLAKSPAFQVTIIGPAPCPMVAKPAASGVVAVIVILQNNLYRV
jgi:hypothetical protein